MSFLSRLNLLEYRQISWGKRMRNTDTTIKGLLGLFLITAALSTQAAPVLNNGDFSNNLTGWTTMNSGDGFDTTVVWEIGNPSGSNPLTDNGMSTGPASRVIYQDFTVPASGVSSSSFLFNYYATNGAALNSDQFTTFVNNAGGPRTDWNDVDGGGGGMFNGTRIDIMDPASNVIDGPVLFNLFAPTDAAPVGTPPAPMSFSFADTAGLTAFLDANAGNTLRLRIGNREETFPWDTGFDNVNMDIVAAAAFSPINVPTLSQWGLVILLIAVVVLTTRHLRRAVH